MLYRNVNKLRDECHQINRIAASGARFKHFKGGKYKTASEQLVSFRWYKSRKMLQKQTKLITWRTLPARGQDVALTGFNLRCERGTTCVKWCNTISIFLLLTGISHGNWGLGPFYKLCIFTIAWRWPPGAFIFLRNISLKYIVLLPFLCPVDKLAYFSSSVYYRC